MLQLAATTDKLQLITSAAIAVDVHASFVDYATGAATPGKQNTAISTATTTDVLAAPAASTYRRLKVLTARNKGASATDVTVQFNQNATLFELFKATLQPQSSLQFIEGVGFLVLSSVVGSSKSMLLADQSVPVALTAINNSVLDATNLKAGTLFKWVLAMSKTAAGIAAQTFEVKFGTAGSTADTTRLGTGSAFTTGTQTAAADVAEVEVRAQIRSIGATGVAHGYMELGHNLAATGFGPTAEIVAQQTSAAFDMTTAGLKATLCTTPGASAVVTVHQCYSERIDP